MVKLAVAVVVFSWALLCCLDRSAAVDPLCEGKVCADSEVCLAVETCTASACCSLEARCVHSEELIVNAGGCGENNDSPLVEESTGQYEVRACYEGYNCPDDFYCNILLMDTTSRCCRAAPPETKSGICPYPQDFPDIEYFCHDKCRSDADCHHEAKCCQISATCEKRNCQPPVFV